MQRSEEKVGAKTPKSAPKIEHQSGNVNVFVLGTAMLIAALWLVFQHDAEGTPTLSAAQAASPASVQELSLSGSALSASVIEEVIVTAPRLSETSEQQEQFERPAEDVALAAPEAPKTFWQSPS